MTSGDNNLMRLKINYNKENFSFYLMANELLCVVNKYKSVSFGNYKTQHTVTVTLLFFYIYYHTNNIISVAASYVNIFKL